MIGVFGGTFDPIHFGHLRPALDCQLALGLDVVRFIPLNVAVHRAQPQAAAALRLHMLQAAIAGQPGFLADPRELERAGPSYSYETLLSLRAELGVRMPLCLLIGADAFAGFLGWYRALDILDLAHLVVMQRPDTPLQLDAELESLSRERSAPDRAALAAAPAGRIRFQPVTQMAVSATRIRALLAEGQSVRYLLPDAVLALIQAHGLYAEPSR